MRIAMMSVYFLPSTVGGLEFHIYHLSRALIRLGHEVEVIQPVLAEVDARLGIDSGNVDGIPVTRIHVPSPTARLQQGLGAQLSGLKLSYLGGFLRKSSWNLTANKVSSIVADRLRGFDVIHQHDFSSSWRVTRNLAKAIPCVLTNHTGEFLFIRRQPLIRWLLKPLLGHYSAIVGPSHELCDLGYEDNRVSYIPNGVDISTFRPADPARKLELRREMGIGSDDLVVICARRWAPTKGIKTLIDAVPYTAKKVQRNVRFLMVGSDYDQYEGYRAEVLQRIDELGIRDQMVLIGNTSSPVRMAEYFGASDVAVLPSLMEATSLAGLEAMSSGLPVVATNVGGLPEIITHGENGLLVEPGNPSALAAGLSEVLSDQTVRERMGRHGRETVARSYSWESVADRTLQIYDQALLRYKGHACKQ